METSIAGSGRFERRSVAALGKLTLAALIGIALALSYLQVSMFGVVPPLALFSLLALIAAGLIAIGWRWTPLLGSLVAGALLILNGPLMLEVLTQPSIQGPIFVVSAVMLALQGIAIGTGVAATAQNYRSGAGEQRTPRGVLSAVAALAGLVVGASLVALLPQPGIAAGVSAQTLAGLPALKTAEFAFSQSELRVKAGETVVLRLENSDPEAHYLDIDELELHAPIPVGQSSLAVFRPSRPGTYLFYCHPHADKARRQGMVGRLIVEQ